jgi:hypothetical protein
MAIIGAVTGATAMIATKWLIVAAALLLLALAGLPVAVHEWDGWVRPHSIEAIHYIPRDMDELSASRRRNPSPDTELR